MTKPIDYTPYTPEQIRRMGPEKVAEGFNVQSQIVQTLKETIANQEEAIALQKQIKAALEAELADLQKSFENLRSRVQEVYSYPIGR